MFTVDQAGRVGEDLAGIKEEEKGSRASRGFHPGSAKQTEIGTVYLSNGAVAADAPNAPPIFARRQRDVSAADVAP